MNVLPIDRKDAQETDMKGTERMRLTPTPARSGAQMANLIHALDELYGAFN